MPTEASKLISFSKFVLFVTLIAFTANARAEYYLVYSEPQVININCSSHCVKKKRYKKAKVHKPIRHYVKPRSYVSIKKYYVQRASPCACRWDECGGGYVEEVHQSRNYNYVTFKYEPYRQRCARYVVEEPYYNLDLTTRDDNPYINPDMNIDNY